MFLSKRESYHFPPWLLQAPPIFKSIGKKPSLRLLLHTLNLNLIASFIIFITYSYILLLFLQHDVPIFVLCVYMVLNLTIKHGTANSSMGEAKFSSARSQ